MASAQWEARASLRVFLFFFFKYTFALILRLKTIFCHANTPPSRRYTLHRGKNKHTHASTCPRKPTFALFRLSIHLAPPLPPAMYHSLAAPSLRHTILIHNRDRSRSFDKRVTSAPVKSAAPPSVAAATRHAMLRLFLPCCDTNTRAQTRARARTDRQPLRFPD